MNAPKFTPGPWEIVILRFGPDEIRSADGSAELICEFPFGAGAGADIQDVANANLIAAAPDGYHAGLELLGVALAAIERGDWRVDGACDPDMAISRMQRFLVKSRGEGA